MNAVLNVLLHDVEVGSLTLGANGLCEFRLLDSYRKGYPRAVLGQRFLDDVDAVWRTRARVPSWFSNLLPEGALRELIASQVGVSPEREFFLLRHLGEDLPGAVRLVAQDEANLGLGHDARPAEVDAETWHFSLAGVQLKFSALRAGRGMTVPVTGTGGDWIVKLPDARYANVPANEHATMQWARESGIEVPEIDLIDIARISGLPSKVESLRERSAHAIRRFDRQGTGKRVHIEDFAQVLGLYPEQKYQRFNYETVARIVLALAGITGLRDFLRRLVFVVGSGNGDAHHKNWSLIYPDGVQARLSPAYDLVSTIQYLADDRLALNLAGSKRWQDVSSASFRSMAGKLQVEESLVLDAVAAAVDDVSNAWARSAPEFGFAEEARARLDAHLASVPLFTE